jgi:ribosomal protein S12 methylthiotransferase
MALQRRISASRNKRLIGTEFPVLVEGPSKETGLLWEARLSTQAPEIDGICYINDFGPVEPRPGEIRTLRITEAHDYDLIGELVGLPEQSYHARLDPFVILPSPQRSPATIAVR